MQSGQFLVSLARGPAFFFCLQVCTLGVLLIRVDGGMRALILVWEHPFVVTMLVFSSVPRRVYL